MSTVSEAYFKTSGSDVRSLRGLCPYYGAVLLRRSRPETVYTPSSLPDACVSSANKRSYVAQLKRFFHEVRFAHSQCNEAANSPFSVEVEMLFEVGKPLRSVIYGDGGKYTSMRQSQKVQRLPMELAH